MGLVDKNGKPFRPEPSSPSFALMGKLLKDAAKPLPWNDPVQRLRATVREITGEPQATATIKWRRFPDGR